MKNIHPCLDQTDPPDFDGQANVQHVERFRRRVGLFKRRGMFDPGHPRLYVERALSFDDLYQAYQLVHETFTHHGYIQPQPAGLRVRVYEALPETATFVAKVDRQVVGVMSVVLDSPDLGLPSDKAFAHELDDLRTQNRRVGEVTNLAVAYEYRRTNVFLELARCVSAHAENLGLDDLFSCVSPGHGEFFETVLRFEPCGELRDAGDGLKDMVEGKRLNLQQIEQRVQSGDDLLGDQAFLRQWFITNNPHFNRTQTAAKCATKRFLDLNLLHGLFGGPQGLLARCTNHQRQAIAKRWGWRLFNQVICCDHVAETAA